MVGADTEEVLRSREIVNVNAFACELIYNIDCQCEYPGVCGFRDFLRDHEYTEHNMRKMTSFTGIVRPVVPVLGAVLLAAAVSGCGGKQQSTDQEKETPAAAEQSMETEPVSADLSTAETTAAAKETTAAAVKETEAAAAKTGGMKIVRPEKPADGSPLTFIGEPFYEGKIENEDDALDAVMSVIDLLGGNENTVLEPIVIRPNEDGTVYYTFRQLQGDVVVYAATVKLVADADGMAVALISSLAPGIEAAKMKDWGVTDVQAEEIVRKETEDLDLEIVEGATERTLLPFEDDASEFYCAWVVYTNNVYTDYDTAYLAHYIDAEGDYLYALPVAEPGNADALSGEGSLLYFQGLEKDTWTGTVKKHDGTEKEITVPILRDPETGEEYLGDLERRIICADYADFYYNDSITERSRENGSWADNELLIYDTFVRVYDAYLDAGWEGPDGDGSPVLLLMDWVGEDGEPYQNACYAGRQSGFQVFQFNRLDPDGECTDIIAHEFTHCMTGTLMTSNIYMNEYGAINEAFSDICGNIIEAMLQDTEDKTWLIQENGTPIRSMSDPRLYEQPEFVWDQYYVPPVMTATDNNDNGGVHINSSLLNLVGYRLNEAGMELPDQLYYWMNVALAMTPRTDYAQLVDLLPWSMEEAGYPEYKDTIRDAISEVGFENTELPESAPADSGMLAYECPFYVSEMDDSMDAVALFYNVDTDKAYVTWPDYTTDVVAATLPEGYYVTSLIFADMEEGDMLYAVLMDDGWEFFPEAEDLGDVLDEREDVYICFLGEGEITELETDTLKTALDNL